ncbi:hypothetical protein [Flexibacterium corallicola]|uniref:hypothetical protein n=1 Tax=Flexibacterium corallicola TaxID=3037259 RepID=UPI00286F6C9E|nr:hypothetical protein [Pseudovibrio sp. M1P-2-3]
MTDKFLRAPLSYQDSALPVLRSTSPQNTHATHKMGWDEKAAIRVDDNSKFEAVHLRIVDGSVKTHR